MQEKNPDFSDYVRSTFKKLNIRGTDTDVYKTIDAEANSKVGEAEALLSSVQNSGETSDKFLEYFEDKIGECREDQKHIKKTYAVILETHKKTYEMWGLTDKDEVVKDGSAGFLKVFIDFFKNAVDALPKEDKKRGAATAKRTGSQA